MKGYGWLIAFLVFGLLTFSAMVVTGQEVSDNRSGDAEVEILETPVIEDTDAPQEMLTHHEQTLAEVRKAIEESEDLGPFRKRVLLRRLNRPSVAVRVTDYVTANALDQGLITVPPPVGWAEGQVDDVSMAIDWEGLITFIERIIPLIVQLIGLFGG